ncbi:MAG: hypothetical protein LH603_12700 [Pseudonocardia sp.]|nr:hypothetical protein [Pseudonocardia sp.]
MTRPSTRLTDTPEIPPPHVERVDTARVVTAAQVDRAVLQLRERPGQTAVEQVQAVLRALDLTVQESLDYSVG